MTITVAAAIDSRPAKAGAEQFNQALGSMRQGVAQTGAAIDRLNGHFSALRGSMIGFAAVTAARIAVRAADDFTLLNTRMISVTGSGKAAAAVMAQIEAAAARSHAPVGRLADAYTSVAVAAKAKGRSEQETISALETLEKLMAVSGATAEDTAQGYNIYTRAVVSGRVEAQAFFGLMERAPLLMQEFQKQTGLSAQEIRRLGELGKISGDTITSVLLNAKDRIETQFRTVPQTIGGALAEVVDETQRAIGKAFGTDLMVRGIHAARDGIVGLIGWIAKLNQENRAAADQFRFMQEVLTNFEGAADRAGQAVSKFASAYSKFRQLAGEGRVAGADRGGAGASVPSVGATKSGAVSFEESEVEKQAKVLLELERLRGELVRARIANDRAAIALLEEEIAVRSGVTKDIRQANAALADQIEAQIRLNAQLEKERAIREANNEIGRSAMQTINDGIIEGIKNGEKFADTLRKILVKLIEMAAQAAFLKPFENMIGNQMGGMLSSAGFNPTVGLTGMFGFDRGGVLPGPINFTSGGMKGTAAERGAGSEAILPLKRGPDGAMGVAMAGAMQRAGDVIIHVAGDATDATIERMRRVAREEFAQGSPRTVQSAVRAVANEHRRDPKFLAR